VFSGRGFDTRDSFIRWIIAAGLGYAEYLDSQILSMVVFLLEVTVGVLYATVTG
jgi:hypothetical protein